MPVQACAQPPVDGSAADAQVFGGLLDIAARLVYGFADKCGLNVL